MYVYMFVVHMLCVHTHTLLHPWSPEEGVRYLGAGVTGVCQPANMGAGAQSLVLLGEQQVLLITEQSLQPREDF